MADPLTPPTDPSFLTTWGNTIAYVALSMLTAVCTVLGWLWSILGRLQKVEDLAEHVKNAMEDFSADLKQHQDEDCAQLNKLHDQYDRLSGPVATTAEAVSNIKTMLENDRTYVHERISEHDLNNKKAVAAYEKQIAELEAEVKAMREAKKTRRPTR